MTTKRQRGGKQAARTIKARYGANFLRECGKKGGNPALLKGKKNE
jgi:hypothetical protein